MKSRARLALRAMAVSTAACALIAVDVAWASSSETAATAAEVHALVARSLTIQRLPADTDPPLSKVASNNASYVFSIKDECLKATDCVYGDKASSRTLVLLGDSHARMWLAAVAPFAVRNKLRVVVLGKDACPIVSIQFTGTFSKCNGVRTTTIGAVDRLRPVAVLLSDATAYPGFSSAAWQAGMTATIRALAPSKARVGIIGDIQVFNVALPSCLAAHPTRVQECSVANPNHLLPGREAAERAAATATKARYIDPTPWLCTPTRCSPVIGRFIAYWNNYHVTVAYSAYLSGVMGGALRSLLRG